MARRSDVKAILRSKSLTGREAAALIIRNFVETDHDRPAILTEAEIQRLRDTVSRLTAQDVQDFNTWMDLYGIVGFTLKEAQIKYLRIRLDLKDMTILLQPFLEWSRIAAMSSFIPYCVTEKQLQDIRERRLQELHCLAEVIDARAGNLSDGRWWTESSEEEDAAILEQATSEIAEVLARHNLEPVRLEERADETEREDISRCFADLGEPENLQLYLTGEQLYQTGLPEWRSWIDHGSGAAEVGSRVRRLRPMAFEVAIVQEPLSSNLDERGWYTESWLERLTLLPRLTEAAEDGAEDGFNIRQALEDRHRWIRKSLRFFLAYQPIYEALSELVGVKLHEDLEEWLADIQEDVANYQELLEDPGVKPPPGRLERFEALRPDLPSFTIDDLRPDPQQIQHLRERMAMALTAKEHLQTFIGWLEELVKEIDETEDRPAEEVGGDEGAEA